MLLYVSDIQIKTVNGGISGSTRGYNELKLDFSGVQPNGGRAGVTRGHDACDPVNQLVSQEGQTTRLEALSER